MCLAIPGRIIKKFQEHGMSMAHVDYSGTINKACLSFVQDVQVGQYVLVHAGFAISVLDEGEAQETLDLLREVQNENGNESGDVFVRKG